MCGHKYRLRGRLRLWMEGKVGENHTQWGQGDVADRVWISIVTRATRNDLRGCCPPAQGSRGTAGRRARCCLAAARNRGKNRPRVPEAAVCLAFLTQPPVHGNMNTHTRARTRTHADTHSQHDARRARQTNKGDPRGARETLSGVTCRTRDGRHSVGYQHFRSQKSNVGKSGEESYCRWLVPAGRWRRLSVCGAKERGDEVPEPKLGCSARPLPFEGACSAISNTTRNPSRFDIGRPRSNGSTSPL